MQLWIGAVAQGLCYAFLALGVYLAFRVLSLPDITADGSITLGAAVAAVLIAAGGHPTVAIAAAMCAGAAAGTVTGLIHTKFNIHCLLAGILTMTGLYSVNLHIMGRSNLSLMNARTIFALLDALDLGLSNDVLAVVLFGVLVIAVKLLLDWFLSTDLGLVMRATGDNEQMVIAQGTNTDFVKILGLAIANALVALSGALIAQYQGFADIGMGIGSIIAGLASVIVGETIIGARRVPYIVLGVIIGSIIFRVIIALALWVGLNPVDLKLLTALFVLCALALPVVMRRWRSRRR